VHFVRCRGKRRKPPPLETIMTQMRAALFERYGPPEVLYAGTRPIPVAGPNRLLVRVHAVTVNGGELILRSGRLPRWLMRGPFPRQTGLDFVGKVAEVQDRKSTRLNSSHVSISYAVFC